MKPNEISRALGYAARHGDWLHKPPRFFDRVRESVEIFDDLRVKHPLVLKKCNKVKRDVHKLKGFIRLVPVKNLLIGPYTSKHAIMDLIGLHFKKRFSTFHVLTWNEALHVGYFSHSSQDANNLAVNQLFSRFKVNSRLGGRMHWTNGRNQFLFELKSNADFYVKFLAKMLEHLYPGRGVTVDIRKESKKIEKEWNAFYLSQEIHSRQNYEYAMRMLGKAHLLEHFGLGAIETQRVLKRIGDGQKSLDDF
ncbi:MAG: DUF4130 domain-containing protein [Promethearchaeota archaeon]